MVFLASSPCLQPNEGLCQQRNYKSETRMSNIEQGISNDEVKSFLSFLSDFVIRYSIFCGSILGIQASYI
jgi:hypothetical protein